MTFAKTLDNRQRQALVERFFLNDPHRRIAAKSPFLAWNTRQYIVAAHSDAPNATTPDYYVIFMAEIRQHNHRPVVNYHSELDEIPHHDCPKNLIDLAATLPAGNAFAQQWRESVQDHHHRLRSIRKLLSHLARNHPRVDDRLVISGREVRYLPIRTGRSVQHHYLADASGRTKRLQPDLIDLYLTTKLRQQPATHPVSS